MRLEDDWVPMDQLIDPEELDITLRRKEAQSRAVVLEMVWYFVSAISISTQLVT